MVEVAITLLMAGTNLEENFRKSPDRRMIGAAYP